MIPNAYPSKLKFNNKTVFLLIYQKSFVTEY